ncbi:hypothetical protein LCGC14_1731360 [marine sediment metagenome]|uniref:Uncharacterized protein n=1 Tax=marine sediment metagenome TaxID=412755 RepID=A0A0F9JQ13_9ZZZZ
MSTSHFVTNRELAFHGNIDFDHFDHTGGEIISYFESAPLFLKGPSTNFTLFSVLLKDSVNLFRQF